MDGVGESGEKALLFQAASTPSTSSSRPRSLRSCLLNDRSHYEPLLIEGEGSARWSNRHRRRPRWKAFTLDPVRYLPGCVKTPAGSAFLLLTLFLLLAALLYRISHLPLSEPWLKGQDGTELFRTDHGAVNLTADPYFQLGDVAEHNREVSARLDRCDSLGLLRETGDRLDRLSADEEARYEAEGCGQNATTVVLLSSFWFTNAYGGGTSTGETVWAQSVLSTLNHLGYAYLFSSVGWNEPKSINNYKTVELWQKYKRNIRVILADQSQVEGCASWIWGWSWPWQSRCLKTRRNPEGIPVWKMLSFDWWDEPAHPLGATFTLSPFPQNDNHFLSFSIEPTCRQLPFRPQAERADPPHAYIHAKYLHYLRQTPEFPWTLPFLGGLQEKLDIQVLGGMWDEGRRTRDPETSATFHQVGLTNLGPLTPMGFYEQLWKSFVLIGMGRPGISPSAYDALCMGVPLINPILVWDEQDPEDRSKWLLQHNKLKDMYPPYVYSVHSHNLTALEAAVSDALHNPIGSFVREDQKFDFVVDRMANMLDEDWRLKARLIIESRKMSPKGKDFML